MVLDTTRSSLAAEHRTCKLKSLYFSAATRRHKLLKSFAAIAFNILFRICLHLNKSRRWMEEADPNTTYRRSDGSMLPCSFLSSVHRKLRDKLWEPFLTVSKMLPYGPSDQIWMDRRSMGVGQKQPEGKTTNVQQLAFTNNVHVHGTPPPWSSLPQQLTHVITLCNLQQAFNQVNRPTPENLIAVEITIKKGYASISLQMAS